MVSIRRPDSARLALLLLLAVLGGCRSLPPAAGARHWPERCAALTADSHYRFAGRIAARSGSEGFSAGIEWQQRGELSEATLRGPLGIGAIHLQINGDGISVEDGAGHRTSGSEGRAFLRDVLGFDPPLHELRYWLLACSAPNALAETMPDPSQRPATLNQSGWLLEYNQYQDGPREVLPTRLRARHGDDSLQLAIRRWYLP